MKKNNNQGLALYFFKLILTFIGMILIAIISRIICEKLWENHIISKGFITVATWILFALLLFISNKIIKAISNSKGESEFNDNGILEKDIEEYEKKYIKNTIYLIEPKAFSLDKVYKLICKNDEIYFCKVGGQLYEINESAAEFTTDSEDDILLNNKYNFKLSISNIDNITLINKKSMHTGAIPNNGIVFIHNKYERKAKKYIVHPINEFHVIEDYFESIGNLEIKYK